MERRYLIVVSGPIDGERFEHVLRECIDPSNRSFHVLVVTDQVKLEMSAWTEGAWVPARARAAMDADWKENVRRRAVKLYEAQCRAEHRLDLIVAKIRAAGGEAVGEVVAGKKPLEATAVVVSRLPHLNGIFVSSPPNALARRLRMDLPERVARITGVAVSGLDSSGSGAC